MVSAALRARLAALAAALWIGGCGNAGEQACLDFAEVALEMTARECAFLPAEQLPALREQMRANLMCDRVVGVADEETLRGTCFVELDRLSCDQFVQQQLPPSCFGKLIYAPP